MRLVSKVALVGLLACLGCGGDEGPPETVTVTMTDNTFTPATVTIDRGGSVLWRNNGTFPHNSTGPAGAWASANLNPGQTFEREFSTTGTFDYTCSLHAGMTGRVVVR